MNILLNGLPIKIGGGIVKFDSLINFLTSLKEHKIAVVCNQLLSESIIKKYGSEIDVIISKYDPSNVKQHLRAIRFLDNLEANLKPDAVITLFGPSFWRPKTFHLMGFAIPHYIYSESPYFNNLTLKQRIKHEVFKVIKRHFFKRDADLWWTESEDVSIRLANFINVSKEKVITIWPSNHPAIRTSEVLPIKEPVKTIKLLTISAYYRHKNFEIFPAVLDECEKRSLDVEMITTIENTIYEKLNVRKAKNWRNLGKVDIGSVIDLYNNSTIVFLPSLLECFSANYTEAMHFRRPIITSNLKFAETACKGAALYFNPLSVSEICNCIEKAILEKNNLISAGDNRLMELESVLPEEKMLNQISINLKRRL